MDAARNFLWARRATILLTTVGLVVGARVALKQELHPQRALELLRSVQHEAWGIPLFALAYLLLTAVAVPVVIFHMISGAAFGFWMGLTVNVAVFNLSVSLQFLVARRMGRSHAEALVNRYSLQRFTHPTRESGFRSVLSLRLLPLPSIITCLAAVLAGIRWRDFALGSAVGGLPSTLIYTYFAAALVEGAVGAEREALLHTLIAGLLLALLTLLPPAIRRFRAKRAPPQVT
ncbi:MAG: TVP38/TMEM64 family protein [Myxococcaceae bacterium]